MGDNLDLKDPHDGESTSCGGKQTLGCPRNDGAQLEGVELILEGCMVVSRTYAFCYPCRHHTCSIPGILWVE